MISSLRFHGRMNTRSGRASRIASGGRIGMCVPGGELALLVGIAIDGEVDEVRADSAVVEQRVALARCAVAGDALSLALLAAIRNSRNLRFVSLTRSSKRSYVASLCRPNAISFSRSARDRSASVACRSSCSWQRRCAASRRASAAPRHRTARDHGARKICSTTKNER